MSEGLRPSTPLGAAPLDPCFVRRAAAGPPDTHPRGGCAPRPHWKVALPCRRPCYHASGAIADGQFSASTRDLVEQATQDRQPQLTTSGEIGVSTVSDQPFTPPPGTPNTPSVPDNQPPAPRSRRTILFVLGGIGATLCVCVAIAALLIGQGILGVSREQAAITPVIQEFMAAMEQQDAASAYELFSSRAQRQTPISDLEALLSGENYVLFEGYETAAVSNTSITASANTNQDIPQGTIATVDGTITYIDGIEGNFRAVLEKENDQWRLFSINVTVPPSKFTQE